MGVEGSWLAAAPAAATAAAALLLLSSSGKCLATSERYFGCSVPHQRSQCVLRRGGMGSSGCERLTQDEARVCFSWDLYNAF